MGSQELFAASGRSTLGVLRLFRAELFRGEFFGGEFLGGGEGVGGWDFYVGLDAGAFPVGLADRIDGAGEGDANHEMVVNAVAGDWMGAASGGLANDGGTLEVLEVVAELLGARESLL